MASYHSYTLCNNLFVLGGSVAKFLGNGLPSSSTDWSKWKIFFCDERHVPFDDAECTYTIYKQNLMSKVAIKDDQVYPDDPSISGSLNVSSVCLWTY